MDWSPPAECTNGHPLRYPTVTVSWGPCECAKATGSPRGHRKIRCNVDGCGVYWYEDGCDLNDPPNRGTGRPTDPGYPSRS